MGYEKMTKAELIEELKQSISIEKYNKLEKRLELRENYVKSLEDKANNFEIKLQKAEDAKKSLEQAIQIEIARMKEDYAYLEGVVDSEYELVEMLYNRAKQETEFGDKLYKLYHKTLFKENGK